MKIRNLILCITGGLLAAFAFPNPIWTELSWRGGFLAFFCLIPLLAVREPRGPKAAWRWGFLYGFIYFGVSIIWMAGMKSMYPLGPLAWLLLTAYLALYPAIFISGYHILVNRKVPRISAIVTLWLSLEFVRNYLISGFPWVVLGYAHYRNSILMSLAPVAGVWGLSFVTVLINALLYLLLTRYFPSLSGSAKDLDEEAHNAERRWSLRCPGLILILLAMLLGALYENLQYQRLLGSDSLRVGVLQGNMDQDQVWNQQYVDTTFAKYSTLIKKAAQEQATLVIWPETAFPGIFNLDYTLTEVIRGWSRKWNLAQLVGSDEVKTSQREGYEYFNSVFLLDQEGRIRGRAAKKHLVPFGEYVPYKDSWFFYIHKVVKRYGGAGFTPGAKHSPLEWEHDGRLLSLGVLVCFESLFPQYSAELARQGSRMLVVVTNDTWFGRSAAPAMHAVFSALRAAENGCYVLRAAASGVSAVFNARGKCLGTVALNQEGVLIENVQLRRRLTIYARIGDWICWICLFVLCFDFFTFIRKGWVRVSIFYRNPKQYRNSKYE